MSKNDTSRFIALILRHKPEVIGITLDEQGLISKTRLYVHLSKDYDTAVKVGSRHGKPVIYKVLSGKMDEDGYDFFY